MKQGRNTAADLQETSCNNGLKQAPRAWHLRLKAELEAIGFTESSADPGLFIKPNGDKPIYLLIYVDDTGLFTNDTEGLISTKAKIMETFEARDRGPSLYFLGMDIIRDRESRSITLAQHQQVNDLLTKYNMLEAKSLSTPLSAATKLTKDGEILDQNEYPYAQLIGSLMYLSICTRPDISQAVGALARYMAKPTITHWQAAKGMLRYLAGTVGLGRLAAPAPPSSLPICVPPCGTTDPAGIPASHRVKSSLGSTEAGGAAARAVQPGGAHHAWQPVCEQLSVPHPCAASRRCIL